MVAKRQSAASGNAVASAPKTRKTRTSAAAVGEQSDVPPKGSAWGKPAPEPEAGVGLDGNTAAGDVGGDKDTGAAPPEPKSRRKGKAAETPPPGAAAIVTNVSRDLIQGVERIERLNEEIDALGDDKKEFFAELKTKGYKTKIIRKLIAERAADPDVVKEDRDLMELYRDALAAGVGVGDEEE